MVVKEVAEKVLEAAFQEMRQHRPGHIFRVTGFPGMYSDGRKYVIDLTPGAQSWRVVKGELIKCSARELLAEVGDAR